MSDDFYQAHRATLDQALAAIDQRGYWSAYAEIPSGRWYGETAADDGKAVFEARRDQHFDIDQPTAGGRVGGEQSPYGFALGITYPDIDPDQLLPVMQDAARGWRVATPEARAGVCIEILARLNRASFEMAHAVQHTTGQAFMMAFQAGGPHAQDRALEAIAYAYREMQRIPAQAVWEKPQGKHPPLTMAKRYHLVPRGVALVIGCCTFPTWNGYPGLFASLVTGNAVLVKPHPGAILPLAFTVHIARTVLAEAGFDPNAVCLAAHAAGDALPATLAQRPEIGIIDFTGSRANGEWLERHAHQARVYTEKSGVNQIIIDSADDLKAVARNVAFSVSLYSGQMCTAPQNIYLPRAGIKVGGEPVDFDTAARAICDGVDKLLGDTARAVEVLGAIQNEAVAGRVAEARALGGVLLDSQRITHPQFPHARVMTPIVLQLDAEGDQDTYRHEWFGPVAFIIATDSTDQSLAIAAHTARQQGAITMAVYATDDAVLAQAEQAAIDGGVALSCNLTGGVFVNQSAAFSDYHATGANPAANACLTDSDFVAGRFRVVQSRRHTGQQ